MDFGDAIRAMRDGKRVARSGWNGKNLWIRIVDPGPRHTVLDYTMASQIVVQYRPYIEMKDAQDMLVPWLASQTDMLATDWQIVE
jgi:hypothetical protein